MKAKKLNNEIVWISAYLYYNGNTEKFLKKYVADFVQTMRSRHILHRYFFIRYYESGYHVRLRLLVPASEESLWKKELERYFTGFLAEQEANPLNNIIWYNPYIQELERYGGSSVIAFAEQQFEASSEFVFNHLEKTNGQSSLPVAIKLNMALLMGMKYTLPQIINICSDFVDEWLPVLYDRSKDQTSQKAFFLSEFDKKFNEYADTLPPAVDAVLNELTMERFNDEPLASYYTSCRHISQQYRANGVDLLSRPDIVRSFMHMNQNRLGIRNLDEAYVIYLLYRTLEKLNANG